jgi:hypothetical protein
MQFLGLSWNMLRVVASLKMKNENEIMTKEIKIKV